MDINTRIRREHFELFGDRHTLKDKGERIKGKAVRREYLGALRSWTRWVKLLCVKTVVTRSPSEAAEFVRSGGIVAFPTETVYGLGADIFNESAVAKLFIAKGRPTDNPLIVHVSDFQQIGEVAETIGANARKLIDTFFPGPLTIVFEKRSSVPMSVTAGLETVGVRMPGNDLAREFLRGCGIPVAAPSANLSGRPSPTTWKAVIEDLDGRIECILQGEACSIGLESTVIDCTGEVPILLRQGAISIAEIRAVVSEAFELSSSDGIQARSPGLKHRHYSPSANVIVCDQGSLILKSENAAFIGFEQPNSPFKVVRICRDVEDYARSLFEFFRKCDRQGIETIYCEVVSATGIGAALQDRIWRAAES